MNDNTSLQILEEIKGINSRLDGMDKKFDNIDKKFDNIDKRFDSIDSTLIEHGKKFSIIDKKLINMDNTLNTIKKSTLLMEHDHGEKIQSLLDQYFTNHENYILLNSKVDDLKNTVDLHTLQIEILENKISQ